MLRLSRFALLLKRCAVSGFPGCSVLLSMERNDKKMNSPNGLKSDPAIQEFLLRQANQFCAELLEHPVLSHYRDEISIILKGSTAHGYSDRYSDVDLVVFCHQERKQEITDSYVRQGLSQRKDGVFLPLHDWAGHYNTDSYEKLAEIGRQGGTEGLWEYSGSKILHDPQGVFAAAVKAGLNEFRENLPAMTKDKYIECQLHLDWLRQPLRRADYGASFLYASTVYATVCQVLFLLQEKPYPCPKWLPYYFPARHRRAAEEQDTVPAGGVRADAE